MNMVNFKIDGIPVSVPAGTTILEAAKQAGIKIPTLCYMKDINEIGACRMCVVEAGGRALQAACVYPVEALPKNRVTGEVVEVKTNTPAIRKARAACVPPTASCRRCAASMALRTKPASPAP